MSQFITPCLWFDGQAEAAAAFYTSVFGQGRVLSTQGPVVEFELAGYRMLALNGGPMFVLNPSISFFVQRETVEEVDELWAALSEGGAEMMPLGAYPWSARYGWLKDRFGVSWQISKGPLSDVAGQTISPLLMFTGPHQGEAEAAVGRYTTVFPNSSVHGIAHHDGSGGEPAGSVLHAQFYLNGETFMAIDSAFEHGFTFNEAVSFSIACADQAEVDRYWAALAADGGRESMCGWVVDRFGVWWQVVPTALPRLLGHPDPATAQRVMEAMLKMRKLDIAALEAAAAQ